MVKAGQQENIPQSAQRLSAKPEIIFKQLWYNYFFVIAFNIFLCVLCDLHFLCVFFLDRIKWRKIEKVQCAKP